MIHTQPDIFWLSIIVTIVFMLAYFVGFTVGRVMCWPDTPVERARAIKWDAMRGAILGGVAALTLNLIIYAVDAFII